MTKQYVGGAQKLQQRITTIRKKLALPPMINEISELMLRRTLKRFDEEVTPDREPWKALSLASITRRTRRAKLHDTGAMRGAIHVIRGSIEGAVYTNTGAGARIGIDDPEEAQKGRWHNSGTPKIPARRFLGVGASDVAAVDSFLRRRGDDAMES